METLKELLMPKTFNVLSYATIILWMVCGTTLGGIILSLENGESKFECDGKSQNMDKVTKDCFAEYKEQYSKIPVAGFLGLIIFLSIVVCGAYSRAMKRRVDELQQAWQAIRNGNTEVQSNSTTRHGLFIAYCCQLAARFALRILFIVLQVQLLYPSSFPSKFNCTLTQSQGSRSPNASRGNIQNMTKGTLYDCVYEQANNLTFWTYAVCGLNGFFATAILIEIICILSRAKNGRRFMEDLRFFAEHLKACDHDNRTHPQDDLQQEASEQQERNRQASISLSQEAELQEPLARFIDDIRKSIMDDTNKLPDLRSPFQKNPTESERTKQLELDQIYTHVVLIPDRAEYDFNGNREERLREYPKPRGENLQPKGPEDIIEDQKSNILVVGRPGIGKTLFCKKFIKDWASGRVFNKAQSDNVYFDVAFLITLRRFNSGEHLSLRDLLTRSEYVQTERLADEVWNYILENPSRVLLIFDGVDEFVDKSRIAEANRNAGFKNRGEEKMPLCALYYKVLSGSLLPGVTILTTVRPTAESSLGCFDFSKAFEILGFTSEQVKEYVDRFTEDDKGATDKIWQHISSNANIYSLCYIPVNCFIICSCLLDILKFHISAGSDLTGLGLPTKLTHIYKKGTKIFYYKHTSNSELRDRSLTREDIESDELPPEVDEKFRQIGKIALNGLNEKRLIFESTEVQGLENSGLFHRLPDRRIGCDKHKPQYCFVHLTMQEFCAAKYMTDSMSDDQLRSFVSDHIQDGEWQVVIQFVAGLLGDRTKPALIEIFTELLPVETINRKKEEMDLTGVVARDDSKTRTLTCWPTENKNLVLTLFKCIYEISDSDSVVQSYLEKIRFDAIDFSKCRLSPVDCTAVVHALKNVESISSINLRSNHIGTLGCVEILKLLGSGKCNLSSLNLSRSDITDECIKQLSGVLSKSTCNLRSLNLSDNDITDEGVKHLCEALTKRNCKLISLNLKGNSRVTIEGIKHLCEALTHPNCTLNSLELSKRTDKCIQQLSKALTNSNCGLKILNLSDSKIYDITDTIKHLCGALSNSFCKISSLSLRESVMTDGIQFLSEALTNNSCKIRNLDLSGTSIKDVDIKYLSKALTNSSCKLSSLDLSKNSITDHGIVHLSKALKSNDCELRKINLKGNEITEKGIQKLSEAITDTNYKLDLISDNDSTNECKKH